MTTKTTKTTKTNDNAKIVAALAAAVHVVVAGQTEADTLVRTSCREALEDVCKTAKTYGALNEAAYAAAFKIEVMLSLKALNLKNADGEVINEKTLHNRAWCVGSVFVAASNGWTIPADLRGNFQKAAKAARDFNLEHGHAANPAGEKGGRPAKEETAKAESGGTVTKTEGGTVKESPLPAAVQAIFPQHPDAQAAMLYILQHDGRKALTDIVLAMFDKMRPKN